MYIHCVLLQLAVSPHEHYFYLGNALFQLTVYPGWLHSVFPLVYLPYVFQ